VWAFPDTNHGSFSADVNVLLQQRLLVEINKRSVEGPQNVGPCLDNCDTNQLGKIWIPSCYVNPEKIVQLRHELARGGPPANDDE